MLFRGLRWLLENDVSELDLTFSTTYEAAWEHEWEGAEAEVGGVGVGGGDEWVEGKAERSEGKAADDDEDEEECFPLIRPLRLSQLQPADASVSWYAAAQQGGSVQVSEGEGG